MKFELTELELTYIIKKFNYTLLIGINSHLYVEEQVRKSLFYKGYLVEKNAGVELSNDVRLLLSIWSNIRYSIIRTEFVNNEISIFILANEEAILVINKNSNYLYIEMIDYTEYNMDLIIEKYLQIDYNEVPHKKYNITLSETEYAKIFLEGENIEYIKQHLGLSLSEANLLNSFVTLTPKISLAVQDVKLNIGCMNMINIIENQLIMIKSITPQNLNHNRVVLVRGNLMDIINSIYIL